MQCNERNKLKLGIKFYNRNGERNGYKGEEKEA